MRQRAQAQGVQSLTRVNFLSRREMVELPQLLIPGEEIMAVISGFYTAGTAILCVTTRRILMVDKKMIRLSIEDLRFDSIKEVNYSHQAFMASIQLFYVGRAQPFQFKTWYRAELRMVSQLIQHKMFDKETANQVQPRQIIHLVPQEQLEAQTPALIEESNPSPAYTGTNTELEKYLSERIARWRKASRFVDTLTVSAKAGRQILELEAPRR